MEVIRVGDEIWVQPDAVFTFLSSGSKVYKWNPGMNQLEPGDYAEMQSKLNHTSYDHEMRKIIFDSALAGSVLLSGGATVLVRAAWGARATTGILLTAGGAGVLTTGISYYGVGNELPTALAHGAMAACLFACGAVSSVISRYAVVPEIAVGSNTGITAFGINAANYGVRALNFAAPSIISTAGTVGIANGGSLAINGSLLTKDQDIALATFVFAGSLATRGLTAIAQNRIAQAEYDVVLARGGVLNGTPGAVQGLANAERTLVGLNSSTSLLGASKILLCGSWIRQYHGGDQ